jgi:hypothetical protein
VLRYFNPLSQTRKATVAPDSLPARSFQAAARCAPEVNPPKIPSWAARNRAASIAYASVTCTNPVASRRSNNGRSPRA